MVLKKSFLDYLTGWRPKDWKSGDEMPYDVRAYISGANINITGKLEQEAVSSQEIYAGVGAGGSIIG